MRTRSKTEQQKCLVRSSVAGCSLATTLRTYLLRTQLSVIGQKTMDIPAVMRGTKDGVYAGGNGILGFAGDDRKVGLHGRFHLVTGGRLIQRSFHRITPHQKNRQIWQDRINDPLYHFCWSFACVLSPRLLGDFDLEFRLCVQP